jgi:hypothetical protein
MEKKKNRACMEKKKNISTCSKAMPL